MHPVEENEFSKAISEAAKEGSKLCIESMDNFFKFNDGTFQGIAIDNLKKCISVGDSDCIPRDHTKFHIDFRYLHYIDGKYPDTIIIPDFIEEIMGFYDFEDTENNLGRYTVTKVVIPKSVIHINDYTFAFYVNLKKVVIEEGSKLQFIEKNAFHECTKLKKIDLSNCAYYDGPTPL